MQKLTNYPYSLHWYAKLGGDITDLAIALFPESDKKDLILSSAPKNAGFAIFRQSIEKNGELLPSKFQCKN